MYYLIAVRTRSVNGSPTSEDAEEVECVGRVEAGRLGKSIRLLRANAGRVGVALVGDRIFFDVTLRRSGSDPLDWLLEEEGFRCRPTTFQSLVGALVGELIVAR